MAAMTVIDIADNTAEILKKQDVIKAKFDEVEKQLNDLINLKDAINKMKEVFNSIVSSPNLLSPVNFPAELSVNPSKITKIIDWAEVIYNAFGLGPEHDETSDPEQIQDMLYALQTCKAKSEWYGNVRGNIDHIKMTRLALSPKYAYYEGNNWSDGTEIYRTSDGITFELWMHEYEEYDSCFPQLLKGKLPDGSNYVYLTSEHTMCSRVILMDGTSCWVADKSKTIPEEVINMDQEN